MTKYREIDFSKIAYCWSNNIYITPEPIKTRDESQMARIDVFGFTNDGMISIKRKGRTLFNQRVTKEKELMYNNIMDAYEYYYDKLIKDEKR